MRDQRVWREVNRRNRDWLRPWEATIPPPTPSGPIVHRPTYRQMVRHLKREANAGRMLPFVIEYRGATGRATDRRRNHLGFDVFRAHRLLGGRGGGGPGRDADVRGARRGPLFPHRRPAPS
ncbi:hypothetical protein GCM10020256_44700 [Streptomyces thermocoprophilus]